MEKVGYQAHPLRQIYREQHSPRALSAHKSPITTGFAHKTEIDRIYEKNLAGPWISGGLDDGNPYTTAFVLEAALDLETIKPELAARRKTQRKKALSILKKAISGGAVQLTNYPPSSYLTQLSYRVLKRALMIDSRGAQKVYEWAIHEIVYQQALFTSKSKSADPYQLCYSVILAAETIPPEKLSPDSKSIIAKALELFFKEQLQDGSWPRSQSLFHYPDFGSAYCYEYELLAQLLASKVLRDLCLRHLPELIRAASALDQTSFKLETGWSWGSGHYPQVAGPESWTTASVYLFAHRLDRLIAEAVRRELFAELGERYSGPGNAPEAGNHL